MAKIKDREYPPSLLILITCFFAVFIFVIYYTVSLTALSVFGLIGVFGALMYVWISHFQYLSAANILNPLVVSSVSGAIGVLDEKPTHIGKGVYQATITTKLRYVPRKTLLKYEPGMSGFKAWITGNVQIKIHGYKHDFRWGDPNRSINESILWFNRGFDSKTTENYNDNNNFYVDIIKTYETLLRRTSTRLAKFNGVINNLANTDKKNIDELADQLTRIMRDLNQPSEISDIQKRNAGADNNG